MAPTTLVLVALAVGFLAVAAGLWMEWLWAWWVGAATSLFTVVADLGTHAPDRGWRIWLVFLGLFVVSAAQGARRGTPPSGSGEARD